MKLEKDEIQKFRDISIYRILGLHNNGRPTKVRCPFHNERTPSCLIRPDNSFHCFGCGVRGRGAIDFCTKMGYSFSESLNQLIHYI